MLKRLSLVLFTVWSVYSLGWIAPMMATAAVFLRPEIVRAQTTPPTVPGTSAPGTSQAPSTGTQSPPSSIAPLSKEQEEALVKSITSPLDPSRIASDVSSLVDVIFTPASGESGTDYFLRVKQKYDEIIKKVDQDTVGIFNQGMYDECLKNVPPLTKEQCEGLRKDFEKHLTADGFDTSKCGCDLETALKGDNAILELVFIPLCEFLCLIQQVFLQFGKDMATRIDDDIVKLT